MRKIDSNVLYLTVVILAIGLWAIYRIKEVNNADTSVPSKFSEEWKKDKEWQPEIMVWRK